MPPVIGFVGFGEAARCFAAHFAQQGAPAMPVFCDGRSNHPPYSADFRMEVAAHGAKTVDRLADLATADVIVSAVVVATALPVGLAIAAAARPGALLVDINASTPGQKRQVAAACAARGIGFVDANLMGAVSLYGAGVPLYCSGDGLDRFIALFAPLGLTIEAAGPEPGAAAAVKMLRSVVTKGMEALLVEALTAASLAGVRAEALRGICGPMDAASFSSFADMCIRTDVLHAERRAVEMEGVVEGIAELGLDPVMTRATASRLRASAALGLRGDFAGRAGYDAAAVLDAYAAASRPGGSA
jgi:3-hydroxyisobutyrate dehydrogenase-like beta-hydroxyacid dehydrogenase